MPRKKEVNADKPHEEQAASTLAKAPPHAAMDETAGDAEPAPDGADASQSRRWAQPYRAVFTARAKGFELGENRRFNQMVFTFVENPGPEVTAKLREAGFIYRPNEKAWTLQANPVTREIATDLARELNGEDLGRSR